MSDMIRFEDMDKDGRLGLNEFYAAFSKLYSKYNNMYRLGCLAKMVQSKI